jgi:exopolyphosphatase / guanosine-5'-triphosphate,3'-diphosphate pyrophosphatase
VTEIVPRWEWRTFGERFGAAEERLAALTPERVQDSDEVYVLALDSDASLKVRDGLLDVKRLQRVNDVGLEQWMPVAKGGFPLSAEEIARLAEAQHAPAQHLARAEYTLEQFVDEVVGSSPELMAVAVRKHRVHYTVGGAMLELSELRTDHGAARTIAVESDDPARVLATVRDLGLEGRPNVSVPRELKTLAGFDAHRFAVIDVGTNSVKFHVGERSADGAWRTITDRAEITRLGEGLAESGRLGDEPIARTVAAIVAMVEEARRDGAGAIAAVGTAWMRIAPNSAAVVDAVRERTGVEIEVIDGEQEGRLAYIAAKSGLGPGNGSLVVFDTGGGSSQFTFGRGERVGERFSVNVGAVRFTERFGLDRAVDKGTVAAALAVIAVDLSRLDGHPAPDVVVGMGGAVTNICAVKLGLATYDPGAVQGATLDAAEVDRQIEVYRTRSADERRGIVGLQPARAEVILAGACIVRTVLSKLGREALTVSDRGLRHGVRAERFE